MIVNRVTCIVLTSMWLIAETCLPLAAAPIAPQVSARYNLLRNPGFEQGGPRPAEWHSFPPKDTNWSRCSRDAKVAHSGGASGRLWAVDARPKGTAEIQWNRYRIPVKGGTDLVVCFWVKAEGTKAVGAGIHFYDGKGKHQGFARIPVLKHARGWTYVQQDVHVPPRATNMGFVLYGGDGGKVWYDDVGLLGTPETTAVRASPRLDGRLDDACWAAGQAISQFVRHTGDALPTHKTRAWVAHDDDNLYVAFLCSHPKRAALMTKATKHDGKTWLDDSVEVFLAPHGPDGDYYQFCVNSMGVIRDSRGMHGVDWESGARAKTNRREDAWTIELTIPFDKLGIDLDVGQVWRINLVRDDWTHGRGYREVATWSLGGFHKPKRFGKVSLQPDLSRFYRADLAQRVLTLEQRGARLLRQLREAGMPDAVVAKPRAVLAKAQETITDLRAMSEGKSPLPKGGWDAVRRMESAAADAIAAARSMALQEAFNAEGQPGKGGFRLVIAHSLQKIRRTGPVTGGIIASQVSLEVARDETESFQLVVVPSGRALKGVSIRAVALAGPKGSLPITWRRVGYVETALPRYATEHVGWWPDPLMPPGPFDVAAGERQPLWFTVTAPPDAAPGIYTGHIVIHHGEVSVAVPVEVRVRNFRLPSPGTLATPFGLYLYELGSWWYGKEYRKMPIETFVRWCEFLGKYRLTPKSIARDYIVQTREDGVMRVDMSALHKTVGKLAPRYYPPHSFCLFRLPNAGTVRKYAERDPKVATQFLHGYVEIVRAYAREWERQKLPGKIYIYGCDEPKSPQLPFLRKAYEEVGEVAPDYPIMQTISHPNPTELIGRVGIWCPLTPSLTSKFYAERKKAGDTLWAYVCCGPRPPYANFFVDQPATAHRVLFWQVRKAGATGLLYYCVCAWGGLTKAYTGKKCFPDVPIHLKDHWTHKKMKVNGDGLLVYPGRDMTPIPSIRLEVIRDGIEDYEYLALLSRLVAKAKALPTSDRPAAPLMRQAEELCTVPESISRSMTDYTADPQIVFDQRRKIADMIELLSDEQR